MFNKVQLKQSKNEQSYLKKLWNVDEMELLRLHFGQLEEYFC